MTQTRIRLVESVISGERSAIEAAAILAVSRQSVSKWVARYRIEGKAGLARKKCGPKPGSPKNRTPETVEREICGLAKAFPNE